MKYLYKTQTLHHQMNTNSIVLAQLLLKLAHVANSFILEHQGYREMKLGLPDGGAVDEYSGVGFVGIS